MYREYFRTVGPTIIAAIVFLCAFQQAASLAYSYWLSLWADEPALNATRSHQLRLGVFAALGLTQGGSEVKGQDPSHVHTGRCHCASHIVAAAR